MQPGTGSPAVFTTIMKIYQPLSPFLAAFQRAIPFQTKDQNINMIKKKITDPPNAAIDASFNSSIF